MNVSFKLGEHRKKVRGVSGTEYRLHLQVLRLNAGPSPWLPVFFFTTFLPFPLKVFFYYLLSALLWVRACGIPAQTRSCLLWYFCLLPCALSHIRLVCRFEGGREFSRNNAHAPNYSFYVLSGGLLGHSFRSLFYFFAPLPPPTVMCAGEGNARSARTPHGTLRLYFHFFSRQTRDDYVYPLLCLIPAPSSSRGSEYSCTGKWFYLLFRGVERVLSHDHGPHG